MHLATSKEFAPLFAHCPHISKVYSFDRRKGTTAFSELVTELGKEDWQEVFDLHQSLRSRLLLIKLFGSFYRWKKKIHRIDKRSLKRNLLISLKVNFLKNFPSQRAAYLKLLETTYPKHKSQSHTELFTGKAEKAKTKEILQTHNIGGKPLVALGSGASFSLKRWPKESFLELGILLTDLGFQPILLGGPDEKEAQWISDKTGGKIINISGQMTFLETAHFLSKVKLAISNDSAIVHFAEAMGTPAIALFGPTVKEFGFGPLLEKSLIIERDLKCRPCSRNGKGTCNIKEELKCLRDISAEEVLLEALKIIGDSPESRLKAT